MLSAFRSLCGTQQENKPKELKGNVSLRPTTSSRPCPSAAGHILLTTGNMREELHPHWQSQLETLQSYDRVRATPAEIKRRQTVDTLGFLSRG